MSDVRFRLIGINQDNRADGSGKAGLTFQAVKKYAMPSHHMQRFYYNSTYYNNKIDTYYCLSDDYSNNFWNMDGNECINKGETTIGGWRDTLLRKDLNDNKSGIIWNAIASDDFKQNATPVLKITNNNAIYKYKNYRTNAHNAINTSNSASITTDKLFILSPSEMGMPIIKNYNAIYGYDVNQSDANVHYYDSGSYKNTIKSSNDGNKDAWHAFYNYIYSGNAYQWWMLPAGSRKMSNGNQTYHNTDSYSFCDYANTIYNYHVYDGSAKIYYHPSTNQTCDDSNEDYYLRSQTYYYNEYERNYYSYSFAWIDSGRLNSASASNDKGAILTFAF